MKKNKAENESTSTLALEQNVQYFNEDKSQERYNVDFFLRKIFNGRYVDNNFFDSYNFEFSVKLGNLGWKSMNHDERRCIP